jgi:hypothetical protein
VETLRSVAATVLLAAAHLYCLHIIGLNEPLQGATAETLLEASLRERTHRDAFSGGIVISDCTLY